MSVIHAPEERPLHVRLLLVPGLLVVVMAVYLGRLWFLQIAESDDLRDRAAASNKASVSKLAPRGKVVDRNGELIAGVRPTVVVLARPKIALKNMDVVARVARMLGIETDVLVKSINDHRGSGELPAPVYVGADVVVATKIAEINDELPGFSVETQPMRYYTEPVLTSHIMGYVRAPREVDQKRLEGLGIEPAAYVGIQGLERQYELELMGQPGSEQMSVEDTSVKGRMRPLRSLGSSEPVPGKTLVLSLDMKLQALALDLLKDRRGAVVAMDPSNGEVLCLASSPTYDASVFLKGISRDEYDALQNDPSKPFFNRATSAAYPPGSTFKIATTMGAWLTDKFSTGATTDCPGYLKIGNKKVKCLGVHHSVAYDTAFMKSCNTYFGHLAELVGRDGMLAACEAAGIGHLTGLDLPGESGGRVATPQWWEKNRTRPWSTGDTVNFGIGQGELAVTPLQMACLVSLVANRGQSYKPHLLRAIVGPEDGAKPTYVDPQPLGRLDASPARWAALTTAMLHVIESGTAGKARIEGLTWGGKTGSAENKKDHETHSWFVGMAPLQNPRIVISVIVENAGHGGEVAAPIGAQIVKAWLQSKPASKPHFEVESATSNLPATEPAQDNPSRSPRAE